MNNIEIAELLRSVAASYEIKNKIKNKFKIIAYERAADAIEHLSSEARDIWQDGKLDNVAGIGHAISKHLGDIFSKGTSRHFDSILKGIPESVFELLPIEGIGAKTAFRLVRELKIKQPAVKNLLDKAQKGEIAKLEGFGEDSQKAIIDSIEELKGRVVRHLLNYALEIASDLENWMKKDKNTIRVDALGSLRRRASTVGDIDIAVSSKNSKETIEHFTKYPNTNRILEKGERTASIIIPGNIQVDLMVQNALSYGSLLQHFTGSKHHNIALREYARSLKPSLSLSEYGIKLMSNSQIKKTKLKKQNYNSKLNVYQFESEEEFYSALGMDWIPPEIREDEGEIDAALHSAQGKPGGLPELVELKEIKTDLQIHSNFNIETSHDLGVSSYLEVIKKADSLGYEYVAFTDHNPSQKGHNDISILDLRKKNKESVDVFNYSLKSYNFRYIKKVFNSLEIDILSDGSLPVSEKGLETLDFALVSVHSSFKMEKSEATKRVLSSFDHPKVKIFAHPTARLLNQREGIDLDWEKIFSYCSERNSRIWLEINADPMRQDLPDYLVHEAVKRGIYLTMGTDSHSIAQMDNMKYAVFVARRGWAEKKNILNTRGLEDFEKMIK